MVSSAEDTKNYEAFTNQSLTSEKRKKVDTRAKTFVDITSGHAFFFETNKSLYTKS